MKFPVVLSLKGIQSYLDQEPEVIELVTEGVMENHGQRWDLSYEESDLTGLAGVTTTFQLEPGKVVLNRTGKLTSQMIFVEGQQHDSLYQMEFGALKITVCAAKVDYSLNPTGGTVDLTYAIDIENTAAGLINYHLDVKVK